MTFGAELGGFLAILYIIISMISKPFLIFLTKLEAVEELFKVKT